MTLEVRVMGGPDVAEWIRMRGGLFGGDPALHETEVEEILSRADEDGLGAFVDDLPVGFAEVAVRAWADGCETRPVGYLEAWFVAAEHRRTGIGRALIEAAAAWTRDRGLVEMGSDAEIDNDVSHAAHQATGFAEVGRIVQYARRVA